MSLPDWRVRLELLAKVIGLSDFAHLPVISDANRGQFQADLLAALAALTRAQPLLTAAKDWVEVDNLTSPPCTAEMLKASDRELFKAVREYIAGQPEGDGA